jgi:hypothetical protein
MRSKLPINSQTLLPIAARAFWALMSLVHASALIGAWRAYLQDGTSESSLGGCIALTVSMLYFLLKVVGVRFIRLRPGKQTWVVACLLVALIHVDCIAPSLTGALAADCTDLLATTTLVGGLTQIPRATRTSLRRFEPSFRSRVSPTLIGEAVWLDRFVPRCWTLASHAYSLRAPPA